MAAFFDQSWQNLFRVWKTVGRRELASGELRLMAVGSRGVQRFEIRVDGLSAALPTPRFGLLSTQAVVMTALNLSRRKLSTGIAPWEKAAGALPRAGRQLRSTQVHMETCAWIEGLRENRRAGLLYRA